MPHSPEDATGTRTRKGRKPLTMSHYPCAPQRFRESLWDRQGGAEALRDERQGAHGKAGVLHACRRQRGELEKIRCGSVRTRAEDSF